MINIIMNYIDFIKCVNMAKLMITFKENGSNVLGFINLQNVQMLKWSILVFHFFLRQNTKPFSKTKYWINIKMCKVIVMAWVTKSNWTFLWITISIICNHHFLPTIIVLDRKGFIIFSVYLLRILLLTLRAFSIWKKH